MDESDAIDALEDLGLTGYEAQVFVALQKLETASASDVDRIADVPRSQVYGAAERLEERGLVEVQQSNPIRYRAVDLEEARERLHNRYERREERAFAYLDGVCEQHADAEERQEDVWTLHGRDSITARTVQLVGDADASVTYAGDADTLGEDLVATLRDRAAAGVDVTVLSADEPALAPLADAAIETVAVSADRAPDERQAGRILVVDDRTVLLSILGEDAVPGRTRETAIWSSETGFATVLIGMIEAWFDEHVANGTRSMD